MRGGDPGQFPSSMLLGDQWPCYPGQDRHYFLGFLQGSSDCKSLWLALVPVSEAWLRFQKLGLGQLCHRGNHLTLKGVVKQLSAEDSECGSRSPSTSCACPSWVLEGHCVTSCPDHSPSLGDKKENSCDRPSQVTPSLRCCSDWLQPVLGSQMSPSQ
jgi:hypothetical protein